MRLQNKKGSTVPVSSFQRAFTLVELLVVVTIIAILISLLLPAMDRAIYQTELTVCAARLSGVATSVVTYASASKRMYPYRPVVDGEIWNCGQLYINTGHVGGVTTGRILDDRPHLKDVLPINKMLQCPLAPVQVDLQDSKSDTRVFASYALWFGVRYPTNKGGVTIVAKRAMKKLGDRLEWSFGAKEYSYNLLAGDLDLLTSETYASPLAQSGHADADGKMVADVQENATNTYSAWSLKGDIKRGKLDTNFAADDTSVSRSLNVTYDDERMAKVPYPLNAYPDVYLQVPKR